MSPTQTLLHCGLIFSRRAETTTTSHFSHLACSSVGSLDIRDWAAAQQATSNMHALPASSASLFALLMLPVRSPQKLAKWREGAVGCHGCVFCPAQVSAHQEICS